MARSIAGDNRRASLVLVTRQIVVAGILGAIAIFLGYTRLGFIPVPNLTGNATIMHVPAILGGVLEGPIVGALAGAIFGIFSWLDAAVPAFKDPSVAILPRVLIGVIAWALFAGIRGRNLYVASLLAGVVGSAANTIGVVGMGYLRGYWPLKTFALVFPQAVAEAIIAAVVSAIVVQAVTRYRSGASTAPEPRQKEVRF